MWFGWVAVYRAARRPLRSGGTTQICPLLFNGSTSNSLNAHTKASTRPANTTRGPVDIEVKFFIWSSSCGKVPM